MINFKVDIISMKFISLAYAPKGNFAFLYFELQHPPQGRFSYYNF